MAMSVVSCGGNWADQASSVLHTTQNGRPIVQVAFFGPEEGPEEDRTCMNSWSACLTRTASGVRYSHCEIRFANDMVCSIHEWIPDTSAQRNPETGEYPTMTGTVHYRKRELTRPGYHFVEFAVDPMQHDLMTKWASYYAQERTPFNQAAMRLNFIFPFYYFPINNKGSAFFCSELVATLLQKVNLLDASISPCTVSPNMLWDELQRMEDTCSTFNRNQQADIMLGSLVLPRTAPGSKFRVAMK